jgi:glycosyltransferase involved in cell wall biosynthesis
MDFFIVTPSFNQRQFLKQTIDGVLSQRLKDEVIYWVFDGGSTDGTKELLKKYRDKLHWQAKKDKGQTDAINMGIKELKVWLKKNNKDPNEVIFAYLNSDDYYLPNTFQLVERFFRRSSHLWLVGDCLIVNEQGKQIQKPIRHFKQFWRFWLSRRLLGILNPIPQPGVFIKASQILKIGFFDERLRYVMDYDYWFRLFDSAGLPIRLSAPLAAFRIHSLSKGGSQYKNQFAEQYQVARRHTKNRVILGLQRLHNLLIIMSYQILKKP